MPPVAAKIERRFQPRFSQKQNFFVEKIQLKNHFRLLRKKPFCQSHFYKKIRIFILIQKIRNNKLPFILLASKFHLTFLNRRFMRRSLVQNGENLQEAPKCPAWFDKNAAGGRLRYEEKIFVRGELFC